MAMGILDGKRILVTGVLTDSSIAFLVGTTRTFTCFSRASRMPAMRQAPR